MAVNQSLPAAMAKRMLRRADRLALVAANRAFPRHRRRVLFDVRNLFGFDAQAPVVRELLARNTVDVHLASGTLPEAELLALLDAHRIPPGAAIAPAEARRRRYAATIITEASSLALWRHTRTAFLHHGSSFANLARQYALGYVLAGEADYLFCLSEAEVAHAKPLMGARDTQRLIVTGQPKLDELVNGRFDRNAFLEGLGLEPARRTVLLTSHWQLDSLFRSADLERLRDACGRHDINLLVTAHANLLDAGNPRFSGGIDWEARLKEVFRGPATRLILRQADNRPMLAAADVLIADHSSVHLEYALLHRPMILFHHPAHVFSDPTFVRLLNASATALDSVDRVPAALDRALADGPIDQARRRELLDYCFGHIGRSASRTADVIEAIALTGEPP